MARALSPGIVVTVAALVVVSSGVGLAYAHSAPSGSSLDRPTTAYPTEPVALTVPSPHGLAYDPVQSEVFVTMFDSAEVAVLSDTTDYVVTTIPVGQNPFSAAYDPTTGEVFVTDHGSNNLSVIAADDNKVVATVALPAGPAGIALSPVTGDLYVADSGAGQVSVVDGATDALLTNVTVGGAPTWVAVDPATDSVFVTHPSNGSVSEIAGATNTVLTTFSVGNSSAGLTYDNRTGQLYVAEFGSRTVDVVNATTGVLADAVPVLDEPIAVAYDPVTNDVYVADYGSYELSVVEVADEHDGATVYVGDGPCAVVYDPNAAAVIVANFAWDEVVFYPTALVSVGTGVAPTLAPGYVDDLVAAAVVAAALAAGGYVLTRRWFPLVYDEEQSGPTGERRRRAEGRAFALIVAGSVVSLAFPAAAWYFDVLPLVATVVTADLWSHGQLVGVIFAQPIPASTDTAVLVGGGIVAAQFALFLGAYYGLRAHVRALRRWAHLLLCGLGGCACVVAGAWTTAASIEQAISCAGFNNPIGPACTNSAAVSLGFVLVLAGLGLVAAGYVGLLVGIFRIAEAYNSTGLTAGAVFLIFSAVAVVGLLFYTLFVETLFLLVPVLLVGGNFVVAVSAAVVRRRILRRATLRYML